MDVKLPNGRYVLAVSGGVDSMVLLDLLSKLPGLELVVAHFDHGIRPDSNADEKFVRQAAAKYGLSYESAKGRLGAGASEAAARAARYKFLSDTASKYQSKAIITAHHQDDLIETVLINLLRGTGRRGLFSIKDNPDIIRPLLGSSKKEITDYAKQHQVKWREDSTNQNQDYLRNYIRHNIINKLTDDQRRKILENADKVAKIDGLIQRELDGIESELFKQDRLDRSRFALLPAEIGNELLLRRFKSLGITDIDHKTIDRINTSIRTSRHNQVHPVKNGVTVKLTTDTASFGR
jgi:tRNA(Ile)-lysidine synthase